MIRNEKINAMAIELAVVIGKVRFSPVDYCLRTVRCEIRMEKIECIYHKLTNVV